MTLTNNKRIDEDTAKWILVPEVDVGATTFCVLKQEQIPRHLKLRHLYGGKETG